MARSKDEDISKYYISLKSTKDLMKTKKFIDGLLERRKLTKLYQTYVTGIKKSIEHNKENKIYVNYRQEGTVTGRMSCAGATCQTGKMGVSFHTLPNEDMYSIRKLFIAPENWNFVVLDYSGQELRFGAHLGKIENMKQAFNEGRDLHMYAASLVFNKKEEKISKEERRLAKGCNFGIFYGGSAGTLATNYGISLQKAQKILDRYEQGFAALFKYKDFIYDFVKKNQYAYTLFGRRRHLPNVKSFSDTIIQRACRQGLNFTVQSPSSDLLVTSMLGIRRRFKEEKLQAKLLATVHDSIEIICPQEETDKVARIAYAEMFNYWYARKYFGLDLSVKMEVDVEVGSSFGKVEKYEIT